MIEKEEQLPNPPLSTLEPLYERHLTEILNSAPFRNSGRSRQFLEYVVRESLSGHFENLKERVIGERLFGRPADYDTGQDSIVRVKANEVRKRLSQFYDQNPGVVCRFDMAAGAYTITARHLDLGDAELPSAVVLPPAPPPPAFEDEPRYYWHRAGWWALGLGILIPILVVVGVVGALAWDSANPHRFEAFWEPFFANSKPVLICVPTPQAYRVYGGEREALLDAFKPHPRVDASQPPRSASLRDAQIVPETGMLIGLGDAQVLASLSALAATKGHEVTARLSSLTSFADLSSSPSVVVGGESNQWHSDLSRGSRFEVTKMDGKNVILDRTINKPVCIKPSPWEPPATYDCAVVTRLGRSHSNNPLLLASGLDHYGTYALASFLTSPKTLSEALKEAPADWESKNLQILLRVERLRDGVGTPQVLAIHAW